MAEIKPTTPTEHLIVELASKMTRYEMALQGCLSMATEGIKDGDPYAKMYLRFIVNEAKKALDREKEAINNGEAFHGNSRR